MKTNKKAILGFAVAMVFSLAFLQGMSLKNEKQDVTLCGFGASYVANYAAAEGSIGLATGWGVASTVGYSLAGSLGTTAGWTGVGLVGAGVLAL